MSDKLPAIYVPTSCGKIFTDDTGSVYESVDAYVRAADASLALDVPMSAVVKYEPAVPRCKTCALFAVHASSLDFAPRGHCGARGNEMPENGSGYCSNHQETK